jgi:hypothetical protein
MKRLFESDIDIFEEAFENKMLNLENFGSPQFKFYIPSKGRSDVMLTHKLLKSYGIDPIIVVEPQEFETYSKNLQGVEIIQLDKNNMGIVYARNWIKEYNKNIGYEYHWQLDDDFKSFKYKVNSKKSKISSYHVFSFLEELTIMFPNIGLSGFIHDAFAFARKTKFELNKQICSVILVKNDSSAKWELNIIDDTDYSLQLLYSGMCTLNINCISYETIPTMKLKGGNTEFNSNNGLKNRQIKLQEKYPSFFKIIEKDGASKIAPSKIWRQFKTEPKVTEKDKS